MPIRSIRPSARWLLVALAFPPAGYFGHAIGGHVDSVGAALIGGAITGAGIGAAQWAILRHRGVGARWIAATAAGLAAGLAAGSALVDYRFDTASLAVIGLVSGLGVGVAQGATIRNPVRNAGWAAATAVLWSLGWLVSNSIDIAVDEQFVVFGLSGALAFAFLQSMTLGMVPSRVTA